MSIGIAEIKKILLINIASGLEGIIVILIDVDGVCVNAVQYAIITAIIQMLLVLIVYSPADLWNRAWFLCAE